MIVKMTEKTAKEITLWSYEEPYAIYNMTNAFTAMMKSYYAVVEEEELVGYFCMKSDAQVPPGNYPESHLDFGIGMKPSLCGKGMGKSFMELVINELRVYDKPLRLTVLDTNKRAITLYENLGFKEIERFIRGGRLFIIMTEQPL